MPITTYQIRPTGESSVSIELVRSGLRQRKHVLFFQDYYGDVAYDPENLEEACVSLVVDANSMICRDAWLKPEQRTAVLGQMTDLFNARECPELVFRSQKVESLSRHRAQVTGAITLRGNTSSTNLEATVVPVGKDQLEIDFKAGLLLSAFGIAPPKAWWGQPSLKDTARLRMLLWPSRANGTRNGHTAVMQETGRGR